MYTLLIFYIVLSVAVSFFCSVAEAVLLSLTPSYIEDLKQKGKSSGAILEGLKDKIDRPLAAILTLNTIAHTAGAAGVGATAAAIWGSDAVGIASAIMTLVILIFSEIIPKTLGAVYWRGLAPTMGRLLKWLIFMLYPFVRMSEAITWLMGGKKKEVITRDEVAALASLSANTGELHEFESTILQNLLQLRSVSVRDIMTPRTVVIAFPEALTVTEALAKHDVIPVSRIPIYEENIDHITGFVLKTDLLAAAADDQRRDVALTTLRRSITTIHSTAALPVLLDRLIKQREHVALVVDEHGGTAGLVTMEDLLETLLGNEIVDEADRDVDMRKLARRRWQDRMRRMGLNPGDKPVP